MSQKTFVEIFEETALSCGWTNRHTTQDVFEADKDQRLTAVVTVMGQFVLAIKSCPGLSVVAQARHRLDNGKNNIAFAFERADKELEVSDLTPEEHLAIKEKIDEFIQAFQNAGNAATASC